MGIASIIATIIMITMIITITIVTWGRTMPIITRGVIMITSCGYNYAIGTNHFPGNGQHTNLLNW